MKYSMLFLSISFSFSCKIQEFKLEKASEMKLKEGFYVVIPPAIEEGKGSIKVTLNFNEFNKITDELIGFYFRGNFIAMKEVTNPYGIEGSVPEKNTTIDEGFPFELKPFEVVVSYKKKEKIRYAKYSIQRKVSLDEVPMASPK